MKGIISILLLAALLGGCASYPAAAPQPIETLPQQYTQFDLVLGWDTLLGPATTVVDGRVRNVRYFQMHDLEIWVALLDRAGEVAARGMTFIIPSDLGLDQEAPFTVEIPAAARPGDRLRFTYKYRGSDGGDGPRGTSWMQTFDAAVPGH